jgi:hypothetical protein
MALLNPIYAFIVPFLILFTVPLAIFAGITTGIAFFVLFCRVIVVYVDIALALLPQYLGAVPGLGLLRHRRRWARYAATAAISSPPPSAPPSVAPRLYLPHSRRHSRQLSSTDPTVFSGGIPGTVHGHGQGQGQGQGHSHGYGHGHGHGYGYAHGGCKGGASGHPFAAMPAIVPAPSSPGTKTPSPIMTPRFSSYRRRRPSSASLASATGSVTPVSECGFGLAPSVGLDRDFEGVGGWRISDAGDEDIWTTINSRLELPDRHSHLWGHHGPHQSRTHSTGTGSLTPGGAFGGIDGYLFMRGRNRSPESTRGSNISKPRAPSQGLVPSALTTLDGDDAGYFPYFGGGVGVGRRMAS